MRLRLWPLPPITIALACSACSGGTTQNFSALPAPGAGASNISYQVRFVNQSGINGNAMIVAGNSPAGTVNLAWLTQRASPGSTAVFRWDTFFGAFTSSTSNLQPGAILFPSFQQSPVAFNAKFNLIEEYGAPFLQPQGTGSTFSIAVNPSVSANRYSVGFTFGNSAIQAMAAIPGQTVTWSPPPLNIAFSPTISQNQVISGLTFDQAPLSIAGTSGTVTYLPNHTFPNNVAIATDPF